jgi:GntR family transcriptional regulator
MTAEPTPLPVYLRLRALLASAILDGEFREGEQLPSVRAFAVKHGANPLTVAKAYQTLQDEGFVAVRRGVGMFVAEGAAKRLRYQEREVFLTQVWPQVRAQIDRLGLDASMLLALHDA